jgi:CRISPR-associated protein Cas5t
MLWLYLDAPFAVFRTFTAGSFRPTAPFMTPSAAYGLLLNLAGINMREDDGKSPMTLIAKGLPEVQIALGAIRPPGRHSLFQQLHNYPVGTTGAERAPSCKGSKYSITPARRAFLTDLQVCIGVRGDDGLTARIRTGLSGDGASRFGLPFLGDSNYLPNRIDVLDSPRAAHWLVPMREDETMEIGEEPMRLTVTIDRADLSRTQSRLFRMLGETSPKVPESAWTAVAYG